jgi:hypothetical protein
MLQSKIYNNGVTTWGLAVLLAATLLVTALVAKWFLLRRLSGSGHGKEWHWRTLSRELVEKTSAIFIVIAAIYAGTFLLDLPTSINHLVFYAFVVALFIQVAFWADRIVSAAIAWRLAPRKTKAAMRNALSLIQFIARVGVWSLSLLLILENLGSIDPLRSAISSLPAIRVAQWRRSASRLRGCAACRANSSYAPIPT